VNNLLKIVLVVAGAAFIVSLVYTKIPVATMQNGGERATTTAPAAAPPASIATTTRPIVVIGGMEVYVDLADTPEERRQGLSGRQPLAENEGMFFVFETDGRHGFWMKDMLFSIDIIWIGSDGRVVDILEIASGESYAMQCFLPDVVARYALEVPGGFAARHNVRVGDPVGF
jgi:uncharacterized protein